MWDLCHTRILTEIAPGISITQSISHLSPYLSAAIYTFSCGWTSFVSLTIDGCSILEVLWGFWHEYRVSSGSQSLYPLRYPRPFGNSLSNTRHAHQLNIDNHCDPVKYFNVINHTSDSSLGYKKGSFALSNLFEGLGNPELALATTRVPPPF